MKNAHILVATPTRGSEPFASHVTVGYSEFRASLIATYGAEWISARVTFGCDNIRARNRIAGTVLRDYPRVTHVLWVDDDQWADDVRLVEEMLATGEHLIGAPYTNKSQPLRWIHQLLYPCPPQKGNVQHVRSIGFGFTITSRECLETMASYYHEETYRDWPHEHRYVNLFGMLRVDVSGSGDPRDEALLSEDYSFCERWRRIGGDVALYAGGIVYHAGMHAWSAKEKSGAIT